MPRKMSFSNSARQILVAAFAVLAGTIGGAHSLSAQQQSHPLFDSHVPLEVEIRTDLGSVLADRGEDPEYHPGKFLYRDIDGTFIELPLELRVRGNFRRKEWNCRFPPLRLDFPKKKMKGTLFEGQNKLKLVTHCQTDKEEFEQNVVQEYLAYRVLNVLTDRSFRVRLLDVTYTDTTTDRSISTIGFLIEDDDDMAKRTNGRIIEGGQMLLADTDPAYAALMGVFQYFIGNTDWSVPARHNVKITAFGGEPNVFAIPYDFDHAGVVDAGYAKPNMKLPNESVRERQFIGPCVGYEKLMAAFDLFRESRDEIYSLYTDLPALTDRERRATLEYYDEFYALLESERRAKRAFGRNCISEPHMK